MAEGFVVRKTGGILPAIATGGTETVIEQDGKFYRVHTYTDVGTDDFEVLRGGEVEYLVVGGGGAGGNLDGSGVPFAGGGGAGGLRNGVTLIGGGFYSVIVGQGGVKDFRTAGGNGGASFVFGIESAGGGGGGGRFGPPGKARSGGSGGGGISLVNLPTEDGVGANGNVPAVSPPQGNDGADGEGRDDGAGGGGGHGAAATNRNGGSGTQFDITGAAIFYAGGGGGAGPSNAGGSGGGGRGALTGSDNGVDGEPNTGGGGGGSGNAGGTQAGNGGSGIVIIRYRITEAEFNAA